MGAIENNQIDLTGVTEENKDITITAENLPGTADEGFGNGVILGEDPPENVQKKQSAIVTRRRLIAIIAVIMTAVLLVLFLFTGGGIKRIVNSTILMQRAKILKADIKELGNDIKDQDVYKAEVSRQKMQQDVEAVRDVLSNPFWSTAGALPPAKKKVNDVKTLLDIIDVADVEIISPLLTIMGKHPLSEIKTDEGLNDLALLEYLRFISTAIPEVKGLYDKIKPLDLSEFDSSGSFKKLMNSKDEITELLDIAEEMDEEIIKPLIPIMEENPLSRLKTNENLNDVALIEYLRFIVNTIPKTRTLALRARALDLSRIAGKELGATYSVMLDNGIALLDIAVDADEAILAPVLSVIEDYPLSELKKEDGLDVILINKYLDLCEVVLPEANKLVKDFESLDLTWFESKTSISQYVDRIDDLLEFGDDAVRCLPVFKGILGDGSDRVLLLVAQNPSEIRSLGGFPAQMGTASVEDGILRINKFRSVWSLMPSVIPESAGVTDHERRLLHIIYPRDATYCPNFERAAYIWSKCYKEKYNVDIDGVISITPVVIQRLLLSHGSIELADGTLMDGENAVRILGRDLYFKYFSKDSGYSDNEADKITNALFRETAEKTIDMVTSEISVSRLLDYYSVFNESMDDRSIQIWVNDEDTQQLIRDKGWNTHLSTSEDQPEIAVFFNSSNGGCKISWFLDMETELSEPTINSDGSRTYTLKVTFSNVITDEEMNVARKWIKGTYNAIRGYVFFFAPSGGTISNVTSSVRARNSRYEDHEMVFFELDVSNKRSRVIQCKITTAPGVEAVPTVRTNNTMTEFR